MGQRIREGFNAGNVKFEWAVEMDEAYPGGGEHNRQWDKELRPGRGAEGKSPVMKIRDRPTGYVAADPVENANLPIAEAMFADKVEEEADLFTDESGIYKRIDNHESVKHKSGEYVRGAVYTNGIESFWPLQSLFLSGNLVLVENVSVGGFLLWRFDLNAHSLNGYPQGPELKIGVHNSSPAGLTAGTGATSAPASVPPCRYSMGAEALSA